MPLKQMKINNVKNILYLKSMVTAGIGGRKSSIHWFTPPNDPIIWVWARLYPGSRASSGSPTGCWALRVWAIRHCFPRHIITSWDSHWSHMRYQYQKPHSMGPTRVKATVIVFILVAGRQKQQEPFLSLPPHTHSFENSQDCSLEEPKSLGLVGWVISHTMVGI